MAGERACLFGSLFPISDSTSTDSLCQIPRSPSVLSWMLLLVFSSPSDFLLQQTQGKYFRLASSVKVERFSVVDTWGGDKVEI